MIQTKKIAQVVAAHEHSCHMYEMHMAEECPGDSVHHYAQGKLDGAMELSAETARAIIANPCPIKLISGWAEDRNLIEGSTPKDQCLKLIQEVGELSDSICKGKSPIDDIGDCIVVLNNIALQHKLTLEECIVHSYEDIKHRKGKMVGGVYIKEADLKEM